MSFDTVEYANKLLARNSELCSRVKGLEAENASLNKLIAEQDAQLKQIYQIIYDTKSELGIK